MIDRIRLEGIEFHGYHGVTEPERILGHRFRVDLSIEMDLEPAGRTDDLGKTIDYMAVVRTILAVGSGESVRLLETLAERMCAAVLEGFPPTAAVWIRVAKIHPPAAPAFEVSAVEIHRQRAGSPSR